MIKRRFYRFEHGDRDAPSESSSSSESDVEVGSEASDDTEIEEEEVEEEEEEDEEQEKEEQQEEKLTSDVREMGEASSSSGYESEDSSVNEVNLDSSGLPTSDDDVATQGLNITGSFSGGERNSLPTIVQHSPKKDDSDFNMADCILKCKSVFKCKLCPRIVCLSEETLKAHLNSKKHARSEKLYKEGRLKLMLNDDGKIEGEIHSENVAATAVSEQKSPNKPNKKVKGRWKQKKRPRQKENELGKAKSSTLLRNKRRKNDD